MANIILVAGTFHGGWYWEPIKSVLEVAGHRVFAPTLSGLDPELPVAGPINLDTHINDVLLLIENNHLSQVVLVGWSYGGMVITGVADRTSAQVRKLVYLDGQLPMSGEREWDLMPDRDDWVKLCQDGIYFYPDEGLHNPEIKSPLERSYLLAKASAGWQTQSWPVGHDLVRESAVGVTELLLAVSE